ncbi:hypothetical protein [uncultured Polaribacter sp.]|uniref:OB-fold protein n=1 Tax=uncultured Polaribacter sp. TaxID=174711 RepID=UPI00262A9A3A|nr:hypothetical protein [uncultured Polaribacter sp.]
MTTKKIISSILIVAILGIYIAYKMYNKPHVDVADTTSDIITTASQIMTDFTSDENKANIKYLEKIIEVSGVIIDTNIENEKGIVTLKTNDDFGSVLCHLSETATQKIETLKQGQTITIKGICTGYLMDVILVKSEIIN